MTEKINPAELDIRQPLFEDIAFYARRTKGRWKAMCPPVLPAQTSIADSHTHVQSIRRPALSLARCALLGVETICDITDVAGDDPDVYEHLEAYLKEAAEISKRIVAQLREGDPVVAAEADPTDVLAAQVKLMQADPGTHEAFERLRRVVLERAKRFEEQGKPIVPQLKLASGCHPQLADRYDEAAEQRLCARLADPRTKMLGEIGLDFSYPQPDPDVQIEVFRRQIRLAKEFDLPLSMHIRDAHTQAFKVLCEEDFPFSRAVLHCCTLNAEQLLPWVEKGCNVAYGGVLTFGKSDDVREGAKTVPLQQLLVETDCPYMSPTPLRGNENAPEYSLFIAEKLASVEGYETPDEQNNLFHQLVSNVKQLLGEAEA